MDKKTLINTIKGHLIVSCQALPGEPLYLENDTIMHLMARAAKQAGACAIRTNSVRDVIAIKKETGLPVIGLIKKNYDGFEPFITPTMDEIDQLVEAKADIIALDCTLRLHPGNIEINDLIKNIKKKYPDVILMADIASYEDGINAWKQGVDFVGTTLSGYTKETQGKGDGPDFELVERLAKDIDVPIIAEGKVHYPEQAKKMLDLGATSVVVGGAITRPLEIATRFIKAIEEK